MFLCNNEHVTCINMIIKIGDGVLFTFSKLNYFNVLRRSSLFRKSHFLGPIF